MTRLIAIAFALAFASPSEGMPLQPQQPAAQPTRYSRWCVKRAARNATSEWCVPPRHRRTPRLCRGAAPRKRPMRSVIDDL